MLALGNENRLQLTGGGAEVYRQSAERRTAMRKQAHDGTTDDEYLITLKVLQQMIRLAELLVAGTHADADYVEAEVHAPYRAVSPFRTVTADEYRAIGRSCTENEQWRAVYETIAPGLSTYQRDAIEAYATTRLS